MTTGKGIISKGGWFGRMRCHPWAGWILAALMLVISVVNLLPEYRLNEGHDLRNRIVGARALERGLNPYDLNALGNGQVPIPALTDPFSWETGISATTASPLILPLYRVFMHGEWQHIHLFWSGLEYLAFILTILLMATCAQDRRQAGWIVVVLLGLFGTSAAWVMHVWAGQYYVFVALLIALEACLLHRPGNGRRLRGVLLGLAIPFRPFLVVVMPALWLLGAKRQAVLACALGFGLMGASMAVAPQLWASFSRLTEQWCVLYTLPEAERFTGPLAGTAIENARLDGYFHWKSGEKGPVQLHNNGFRTGINTLVAEWRARQFGREWKKLTVSLLVIVGGLVTLLAMAGRRNPGRYGFALLCCAPLLADLATPVVGSYNIIMGIPAVAYVCLTAMRERLWLMIPAMVPLFLVLRVPTFELLTAGILILAGLVTFAQPLLLRLQQWISAVPILGR